MSRKSHAHRARIRRERAESEFVRSYNERITEHVVNKKELARFVNFLSRIMNLILRQPKKLQTKLLKWDWIIAYKQSKKFPRTPDDTFSDALRLINIG